MCPKYFNRTLPLFIFVILVTQVHAQTLFPGVTGQALLDSLVLHYKPASTLSYDDARDTLFAVIENAGDDSLHGVYSDYSLHLDPAADPTKSACNGDGDNNPSSCNGSSNINTEHVWPQSYGASSGLPKQDMHHLFPARADVNSTRNNHPYGEIDDADTDKWFLHGTTLTSIPTSNLDAYAESDADTDTFEPPEDRKGDLARAMFYFYTMYKEEADASVASNTGWSGAVFFDMQKTTLRLWNEQDPPDSAEKARSTAIAFYEDGKENPFVLDPSLVDRAYFSGLLPVEVSSFHAIANGSSVALNWTTVSETNNAGFDIQHQRFQSKWADIGFVVGNGTTSDLRAYTFSTPTLSPGLHRFRLQQVDFDGHAVLGPAISLEITSSEAFTLTKPYPNPFDSETTFFLSVVREQPVDVAVFDVLGRRVASLYHDVVRGGERLTFRLEGAELPGGIFLIRAQGTSFRTSRLVTHLR